MVDLISLTGAAEALRTMAPDARSPQDFMGLARSRGLRFAGGGGPAWAEHRARMIDRFREDLPHLQTDSNPDPIAETAFRMALVAASGRHMAALHEPDDTILIDLMIGNPADRCDLCDREVPSGIFTLGGVPLPPFMFTGNFCDSCSTFAKELC